MIVVDTGSRDETPHLAESLGAQVLHFPWCDDFAAARNASLRPARGKWIFWMDSDDTIMADSGQRLRGLADASAAGSLLGYILQVHCPHGSAGDDVTVVDHVKMFRNLPDIRFEGRIHEQVLPSIRRLGGEVAWTDIFVTHSGADHSPSGRQRKQQRDLRLLEMDLRDRPNHPFVLFNLGMTYVDMGAYEQAAEALHHSLSVSQPHESHLAKANALLVQSLQSLERWHEANEICRRAVEQFPDDPELLFRQAMLAHHLGALHEAAELYRRVIEEDRPRRFSSIDRGIVSYKARQNLAVVCRELGRLDLAELSWRELLVERNRYAPGWEGLTEALLKAGRFTAALIEIDKMELVGLEMQAAVLRAEVAASTGEHAAARQQFAELVLRYPQQRAALDAQCKFLFHHGAAADAEAAIRNLVHCHADGAAFHNLGSLLMREGRIQEAINAFENSLRCRPHSPQTQFQLSQARAAVTTECH